MKRNTVEGLAAGLAVASDSTIMKVFDMSNIILGLVTGLAGLTGTTFLIQQVQANPNTVGNQSISGQVVRFVDDDEFYLNDGTKDIKVDAEDSVNNLISVGQQITVTGRYDDGMREFDAYSFTLPNGEEVIVYDD